MLVFDVKNSKRFPSLMQSKFLTGVGDNEKADFLDGCQLRDVEAGAVILRQGEAVDNMLMVASGRIEISYLNEVGQNTIIYHAFPGNVLGTVETLSERPCAGSCVALVASSYLICSRSKLFEKMKSPSFVKSFAADLHDVLTHDNQYKSIDQFYSAEQKICVYLMKLSSSDGVVYMNSQSYLADVVGCTRQTVNKELGRLRDMGVVEIGRLEIKILDHAALSNRLTELGAPDDVHKRLT